MSRLIRMDHTGHTTIAEWSIDDPASTQAAMKAFDQQLEDGCFAVATAGLLAGLDPITIPVGVILLGHAWAIPELYAARGAKVARASGSSVKPAEAVAAGLLGDLIGHRARELWRRTQLVLERGRLG